MTMTTEGAGVQIDRVFEETAIVGQLARHVLASSGDTRTTVSPVDGAPLATLPVSSIEDVRRAFHFARRSQLAWTQWPVASRAAVVKRFHDLLLANRDECLDLIQIETGKARKDALEELLDVCVNARHYARDARRLLKPRRTRGALPVLVGVRQYHRPKGVVGIISPWNYPFTLAASDALAAVMAGNSVVLKPDSKTPLTALYVARLFEQAGLPEGVFTVVAGSGATLGPAMIAEADYMMFTGSTKVGRGIAAACGERLIGCSLELGGKNAMIVLGDADLDKAVEVTVRGAFANSGQLCVSMERIYVAREILDEFAERLVARIDRMRLATGVGWGSDMGSLIDGGQVNVVQAHVDDAVAKGATVLVGGKPRPDVGPFVFEPTVLAGVTKDMVACRSETFGPVISLYPFDSVTEAITEANDSAYGLNAAVVTSNLRLGQQIAGQIRAGTVNINEGYAASWGSTRAPMGGFGDSGLGRRHGDEGLLKYTEAQTIATMRALGFGPQFGMNDQSWGDLLTVSIKYLKKAGLK
jgi:succinate-semialdehyde dehydrogenase/glutarate-semialdehyde dehydrogenase